MKLEASSSWIPSSLTCVVMSNEKVSRQVTRRLRGFSVGFCINEEEGYTLPTWAQKIWLNASLVIRACCQLELRKYDWMLQSSSGPWWRLEHMSASYFPSSTDNLPLHFLSEHLQKLVDMSKSSLMGVGLVAIVSCPGQSHSLQWVWSGHTHLYLLTSWRRHPMSH